MYRQKSIFILLSVLFVLLLGTSVVCASDINDTTTDNIATNDASIDSSSIDNTKQIDIQNSTDDKLNDYSTNSIQHDKLSANTTETKKAIIQIIAPVDTEYGDVASYNVIISDSETHRLLNGTAVIKINGKSIDTINVTQGIIRYKHNLANTSFYAGTHNLTIVFNSPGYNRTENSTNFVITKTNIKIEQLTYAGYADQVLYLNETLVDQNNNPLYGNIYVSIKVNGITSKNVKVTNGRLVTNITIPQVGEGASILTFKIGNDIRYNSVRLNNTLIIRKQNVTVTLNNITAKAGSTITFKAKLLNSVTKTPVSRGHYVFKINGVTLPNESGQYVAKQVSNGNVNLTYKIPSTYKAGSYVITLRYSGTSLNYAFTYTAPALTIKN